MTDAPRSRPRIRPPFRRRLREAVRRGALGVVWLAAAVSAWLLHRTSPDYTSVRAVAETVEYHLAADSTARVTDVPVAVGETVRAGDLVAVLDSEPITRELAVLAAELEQRNAELLARTAAMGRERLAEERSFAAAVDAAEVALLETRVERDAVKAELAGVRARERRQRTLVSQRVTAREELDQLEADRQLLTRRARLLDDAVVELEAQLTQARERLEAFRATAPTGDPEEVAGADPAADPAPDSAIEAALAPEVAAIAVARARLAELEARRQRLFLRAPADAIVHRVLLRAGDVAAEGQHIAVLRAAAPRRVLAYVDDGRAQQLRVGSRVAILDRTGSREERTGRIVSLGAGLTPYPNQLQSSGNPELWGREIVIEVEEVGLEHAELVPGQVLDVRIPPRDETAADSALAAGPEAPKAPAVASDAPRPADVPTALRRRTRIEPSAIVWSASHDRFLVASDDTGYPDADDHAPWLLLMGADGVYEAAPLVVSDLAALNDVEAMAWLDDGQLLLLSSQSTSRRGKRPRSRTLLVAASVDGVRLRATAAVSLARALTARATPATYAALGLDATGEGLDPRLDIEGMAVDDGALLLGLKEPLGEGGCALVWRLSDPGRVLAGEGLAPGQLGRHACLRLHAEAPTGERLGGVSDLLRLPDGGLLVLSSDVQEGGAALDAAGRPVREPSPGGAAWYVSRAALDAERGATISPRLLRRFEGARPEGAALTADGREIVVVFDRGSETPLWTTLALPTAASSNVGDGDTLASQ